jgi:hypothetical protein
MIFIYYLKFNKQMIILFLFNGLSIKSKNNPHSASDHNIIFIIKLIKSLSEKIKIISLSLIFLNIKINIIILSYFFKEITITLSFKFLLDLC